MVLQNGDILTKPNGETYTASAVSEVDPTHFDTVLDWTNPPPVGEQLPFHVYSPGCVPLKTLDLITRWDVPPIADGPFRLVFYALASDGSLLSIDFTSDPGKPHTTTQKVVKAGSVVQSQTIVFTDDLSTNGTSLQHPIGENDNINIYSDGDSGQIFWYASQGPPGLPPPPGGIQNTSYNLEPFDGSLSFVDVSCTIEPLVPGTPLTFSALAVSIMELGQIGNNTENGTPVSVAFMQEPDLPPCGVDLAPLGTNVCMMDGKANANPLFGGIPTGITAFMGTDLKGS